MDWLVHFDPFTVTISLLIAGMGVALIGMWLADDEDAGTDGSDSRRRQGSADEGKPHWGS